MKILKQFLVMAVLLPVFSSLVYSAESPKDHASWWIKNYGAVEARNDELVGRAEKVFERVNAAADKKGNRFPGFAVINEKGDPWAVSIRDGTVILTYGAIKTCYNGVSYEKGDARLAFIIGHELAHLANDDFWHAAAFDAVRRYADRDKAGEDALLSVFKGTDANPSDPKARDAARLKEFHADQYGLIYMTIAGYDPKVVVDAGNNFFEQWTSQITGRAAYDDGTHPGPSERANFLRVQLAPVIDSIDLFNFGVRLYHLGRFSDAILLLEAFKEKFQGREVFNDIGLSHYQLAAEALSSCDTSLPLKFKLSTVIDDETLAARFRTRGARSARSACFQNDTYKRHMAEAIKHFEKAVELDKSYIPARVNLSSAFILSGEYAKALAAADDALKISPDNMDALNNKAVALYLFGNESNIDSADTSLGILKEISLRYHSSGCSIYNTAAIQEDRGRGVAAKETWRHFLKTEPEGAYADEARRKLGMEVLQEEPAENEAISASVSASVKLGSIGKETRMRLNKMKKRGFIIGSLSGEVYSSGHIKLLVIDDSVEIVEETFESPLGVEEFAKTAAGHHGTIKNPSGETWVYNNFALDVAGGKARKVVYFER